MNTKHNKNRERREVEPMRYTPRIIYADMERVEQREEIRERAV